LTFLIICLLVVVLSGCFPAPAVLDVTLVNGLDSSSTGKYWPTQGWRISPPQEQEMDTALLAQMLEAVQKQSLNLHSLLVIRHDYIVSENYFGANQ